MERRPELIEHDAAAADAAIAEVAAMRRRCDHVHARRKQLVRAALLHWRGPAREQFEQLDRHLDVLHAQVVEELDHLRRSIASELQDIREVNRLRLRAAEVRW